MSVSGTAVNPSMEAALAPSMAHTLPETLIDAAPDPDLTRLRHLTRRNRLIDGSCEARIDSPLDSPARCALSRQAADCRSPACRGQSSTIALQLANALRGRWLIQKKKRRT